MPEGLIRSRGRLPHWESEHGIYFVTFRLADSMPQTVVRILRASERAKPVADHRPSTAVENVLDSGVGACVLRNPAVADVVAAALQRFDRLRYRLFAWCIMPNHVHVVFEPTHGTTLAGILHSWKSYTASTINRLLSRRGALWQREYYDHLIRDSRQLKRAIAYTLDNPRRSGLKNWPYVYASAETFGGPSQVDVSRKNRLPMPKQTQPRT
jgi:REP element-mobilizing transposase RayT